MPIAESLKPLEAGEFLSARKEMKKGYEGHEKG
jgi:hypothetical protein